MSTETINNHGEPIFNDGGGSNDLTSLENKTQNILVSTSDGITNFTGIINLNGVPLGVGGGGTSTIEVGTLSQMLAKTDMSEGSQFFVNKNLGTNFTSQENKLYYANLKHSSRNP